MNKHNYHVGSEIVDLSRRSVTVHGADGDLKTVYNATPKKDPQQIQAVSWGGARSTDFLYTTSGSEDLNRQVGYHKIFSIEKETTNTFGDSKASGECLDICPTGEVLS